MELISVIHNVSAADIPTVGRQDGFGNQPGVS